MKTCDLSGVLHSVSGILCLSAIIFIFTLASCVVRKPVVPEPVHPGEQPKNDCSFVYIEASSLYLKGEPYHLKGANYFPVCNSWRNMWLFWDEETVSYELELLRNIGVNTVRVFIPQNDFTLRDGSLDVVRIEQLDRLIEICAGLDMRIILTLFMWSDYRPEGMKSDIQHARLMAEKYGSNPQILAWDISNELDHRWTRGKSTFSFLRKWADSVCDTIRNNSSQLIICGDYGHFLGDRSDWDGKSIKPDLSLMTLAPEKADAVCFHWYGHHAGLKTALEKLRICTDKPIIVEEIGLPTAGRKNGKLWQLDETQVAGYTREWIRTADVHGVYLVYWCGFDFIAGGTGHINHQSTELYFGLFATDYRLKSNGVAFSDKYSVSSADRDHELPIITHYERE